MLIDYYKSSWENLRSAVRLAYWVVGILFILVVVLLIAYFKASGRYVTHLVPANLQKDTFVAGDYVDKYYLIALVRDVASLAAEYTPYDIDRRVAALLSYASSKAYASLEEKLDDLRKYVLKDKVIQTFVPYRVEVSVYEKKKEFRNRLYEVSPLEGEAIVYGVGSRRIGVSPPIWKAHIEVRMRYKFYGGLFKIEDLTVIVKDKKPQG